MFKMSSDSILRREPLILLAILLLALILRIPVLVRNPIPAGDGVASNLEVAVNLRDGYGFSTMRKWNGNMLKKYYVKHLRNLICQ